MRHPVISADSLITEPPEIKVMGVRFDDLHRGGWDPEARLADQDRAGVAAEVIYPRPARRDDAGQPRLGW